MKEMLHRVRSIGAMANESAGIDSARDVEAEFKELFKEGWVLFATHYISTEQNAHNILYIFTR